MPDAELSPPRHARAASSEDVHNRRVAEILDGLGEAFVVLDFDWRVSHCNRAAEAHFGFGAEVALGRVIWDLVPGRDGPMHRFLEQVMAARVAADTELASDLRPGHSLAIHALPLETGIGVSFHDLSEGRERLRREQEQAERLEVALAAAGFGDWSWDAATDLIDFSERAAAIWGIPPGAHLTWREIHDNLLHPEDRDRARRATEQAMTLGASYEIEYRVTRPLDGELRWVMVRARGQYDAAGKPSGMVGILADITRVKDEEAQVRADRERLAELERRRAFLLEVADTLNDLEDPEQIMAAGARLLGERLGAGRAGYAEMLADEAKLVVRADWAPPGSRSFAGRTFRLGEFGAEMVQTLRAGRILRVDDAAADPRSAEFAAAYATLDIRAFVAVPLIRGGRLEAFVCLTSPTPRTWGDEDTALMQDVATRTWSSLARARIEHALRESEARFRAMADSAPAPVWVNSAEGPVAFVNRAFSTLIGKPVEELLGVGALSLIHPEDAPAARASRDAARRDFSPYEWTARVRRHDGEWRWMQATCQPRFDAQGFQGYVGLAVDVTEARRAEERHRLLVNELNHRVKNTLATVQSLAHQTLRERAVMGEARHHFTERLLALSAAHNVLTRQNWEAAELCEIVAEAMRPFGDPQGLRISVMGPMVNLPPNIALALSMGLHELATNAVKYGALSAQGGRVAITWARESGRVRLEWRETGGPPVREPKERGFGSRLLNQGLAAELGAPAELSFEPQGLVCRLTAPVST